MVVCKGRKPMIEGGNWVMKYEDTDIIYIYGFI
jgi:hypothetical protein